MNQQSHSIGKPLHTTYGRHNSPNGYIHDVFYMDWVGLVDSGWRLAWKPFCEVQIARIRCGGLFPTLCFLFPISDNFEVNHSLYAQVKLFSFKM